MPPLKPRASGLSAHLGTAGALAAALALPAQALTIVPTFAAGVDAASQTVILNAIGLYQSTFADNVTVSIRFENMTSGLGQSSTFFYQVPYTTFISRLRTDASSPADATAMAHIALGANPVTGGATVELTRANANAIGFAIAPPVNDVDSTIGLNLGLMNTTRTSINPSKYDLQTVVMHEIDEVLGTTSGVGQTNIAPMDLFRYTAAGARSFTTAGDDAHFSIDGSTLLVRFNQSAGADYGDWWSIGAHTVRVQDAFGTAGSFADLGVELTALDVVGFNLVAVPEPGKGALMLAGLAVVGLAWRRKGLHRAG